MSASLVVSEMCIRDSMSRLPCARRRYIGVHVIAVARKNVSSRCGPAAVSYTHLTLPTICSV
eukprot:8044638-Alexandrium_andersonii.AAC.1